MPDLFDSGVPTRYARVAVERGIDRYPEGLTYAVPPHLEGVAPGDRVVVPLGASDRDAAGYVIEIVDDIAIDPSRVKPIARRDDTGVQLPVGLLRWPLRTR